MKRLLIGVLGACAALLVAAPAAAQDAKVEKGKKVYEAQKCSMCHSVEGTTKVALEGVGSKLQAADIKAWIVDPKTMAEKTKSTRKPAMRAYPNLPAEDLDALVAYMQSLKKK